MTNHHPVMQTFLIGWCIDFGRMILNDNFGLFIYSLTQLLVLAFTLSLTIKYLNENNVNKENDMSKSVEDYQKEITRVMKAHRTYTKALDMQIHSLASALRNLDLANQQIDTLSEVTVWETTRYGEKLAPHPVFKIAKDAQDMITRQMKALSLTVDDLAGETDEDPLTDLTKKLVKKRKAPKIIKPLEEDAE